MFDASSIIVGLEIGTSKVCAVVGELSADGALNIVGLGQARSRGVRKGEIADAPAAEEDVRHAIVEAEQMADVEIRSVYLGVTGGHVRGFNNRGVHPVVSADREISEDDVQDVIKNAKTINLPAQNHVIHAIRQHFLVDGQDGITNPVGMLGSRVEVDVHVVHGNLNRLQNAIRTVKGLQLEVDEIVFNGLASSLALLTNEQKELGSLVIDIGGGTTEYVVYANGIIKHTGVLAVGGDHVSNDLAYGLKVPLSRAEQLKIEHGSSFLEEADKGPDDHHPERTRPAAQDRQPRTPAPHHVAAAGGDFPAHRPGPRAGRGAGLSARGRFPLRRRRAHPADRQAGRAGPADAGVARQDQFDQRAEVGPGPAGIRHGHRPGEIRLVSTAQARGQVISDRGHQEHPRPVLPARLTHQKDPDESQCTKRRSS